MWARKVKHERIDKLLVERGLAESRTKAQALVMAGVLLADEQRINKPSDSVSTYADIRIKGGEDLISRYVGRGGIKLDAALREFQISVKGLHCLDVGASTRGFTDCLLQHGARKVVAVDVGHNQLDWRLRTDARVEVREGFNARYLKPDDFQKKFDLAIMDVSFISATKIMPAIRLKKLIWPAVLVRPYWILLEENGLQDKVRVARMGIPDRLVTHGDPKLLLAKYGLDADGIYMRVKESIDVLDDRRTKPQKVGR